MDFSSASIMVEGAFFLLGSFAAMTLSAMVGFGGSLLIVPVMLLLFSPKAAIAIAALALGINNIGKVAVYRTKIPWVQALPLALITSGVSAVSSAALLLVPDSLVLTVISLVLALALSSELMSLPNRLAWMGAYSGMAIAGISSGLSGTSGPTKGFALRTLQLPKEKMVAASSLVSLFGDVSKASVFFAAGFYQAYGPLAIVFALLAPFACLLGMKTNRGMTEAWFRFAFWIVSLGYFVRFFSTFSGT